MPTERTANDNFKRGAAAIHQPSPHHLIEAMLHTMRCITQYEDALCELSHEATREGALSEETRDELRDILEKIPSREFLVDLDSVRMILADPQKSEPLTKASKPAVRKNTPAAKKKTAARKPQR